MLTKANVLEPLARLRTDEVVVATMSVVRPWAQVSDSDLDSTALLIEPTLRAWGIPYRRYGSDRDAPLVAEAWDRAHREARPVALLLTRSLV